VGSKKEMKRELDGGRGKLRSRSIHTGSSSRVNYKTKEMKTERKKNIERNKGK